ncbi:hypothetical protein [Noviherbaspirillum saxi]|uniref:DUF4410 domain-containing protein n=1 Tax=Noviherbaspirillum saxi TaxID=2320863 RepID=A0A3A3FP35_9BURK|nr:hypothetical protein [Noviherbaspirillum saxi]RJF97220.1 hypothetical protein D3871_00735 [Noviherbaspirillum saxi]
MKHNKKIASATAATLVLLAGCATQVKTPTTSVNPAPEMAFSRYNTFTLKPINTTESCDKQHGGDVALNEIQASLDRKLGATINTWNTRKAKGVAERKLVIEPVCSDAKLVGGAARFWGGALAGSSAIVMKIRYVDQSTGKTIAEPVFYQRAAAMGGAWTMGATDKNMLVRIVDLMTEYTINNYQQAVGGPTGL